MSTHEDPSLPALEARGLSVAYPGAQVISGLDLAVPRGALTTLLGPNGCGKSTLLRALARLIAPARGEVRIDGRPVVALTTREVARRVSLLPQSPTAPEGLSVFDLIRQGRYPHRSLFGGWTRADEAACAEALRLTGLEPLAARPLESLSGGQRQRAWIAMTLAQQSGVLLLDEPTTYLDIAHQEDLLALLRSLVETRGATVVAVLHDVNQAARWSDHIVMMKAGAIAARGAPEEVMTAERIEAVFGLRAVVTPSPVDGAPMALPARRRG
ncbi:MAG: ABC transporter ATP-binding protein [Pikeienuella sp.]